MSRLAEIRTRTNAATQGPWKRTEVRVMADCEASGLSYDGKRNRQANAEFMAHARADIPWLLDRVQELEEALRTIAEHSVISEGEFPDDNCDWHCTAEIVEVARAVLVSTGTPPDEETTA
jgi:hypothetical protein